MQSVVARSWLVSAGVLVVLVTVTVLMHPGPLPGEIAYIRGLQDLGEPVPSIAELARTTTGTTGALVVMIVPAAWAVGRFRTRGFCAVVVALLVMLAVQPGMKEIVDRPRPMATQVDVRADHTSKSFPSGHSMSTTVVWGALAGFALRRQRPALATLALVPIVLTFFAGGVQGVHWPTDAIGGTLLGALAAWAVLALLLPPASATASRPGCRA